MHIRLGHVDFLRRPPQPLLGWLLLFAAALALAASVVAWTRFDAHRTVFETARQARSNAERKARMPRPAAVPTRSDTWETKAAEAVRQPWLRTLRVVERLTEPPLALLSLAVEPATGTLRIEGEAPDFDAVLGYVRALDEGAELAPARLLSHVRVAADLHSTERVRFVASATWRRTP